MSNDTLSGLDELSGLIDESEIPHLSDAISYETDIKPYRYWKREKHIHQSFR